MAFVRGYFRSYIVNMHFFAHKFLRKRDGAMRMVPLCSVGQAGSIDMHVDLLRSLLDLKVTGTEVTSESDSS